MGETPRTKFVKKTIAAKMLIAILMPIVLSGCWDQNEVSNVGFIIAGGLDTYKGEGVSLTIQVFIPNPTSGGSESSGEGRVLTYSGVGSSVPEAMSTIQNKLPRMLSWDHAKLIIFGEELAVQGVKDELDYLFRDLEPREQVDFLVCRGTAKKLIQSLNDPNTYDTLIRLSDMPSVATFNMNYVKESILGETKSFVLPVADTMPIIDNAATSQALTINGSAVMKDGKLVGWIAAKDSLGLHMGFHWLHKRKKHSHLTLSVRRDDGTVSARFITRRLKLIPRIDNGNWKMSIFLKVEMDVVQNSSSLDLFSPSDRLRDLEGSFESEIKRILQVALVEIKDKMGADVIGFARSYHKKYPREWKKVSANWDEVFRRIPVSVDVECKLRSAGIANVRID